MARETGEKYLYEEGCVYIERALHTKFKMHCFQLEIPMKIVAAQLIREYLEKNLPKTANK